MIGKKISMAVVLLCAVGAAAEDIVLFDASKPADNAFVFNPHSRDMRPVKRDSSGRIILENNFRIVGDFDLSKNTDIKIDYDFEDSDYENVISLDFYPKGVKASREYNRALSAVLNRKKSSVVVEGYQNLAYPQILAQMKLMRTDPFRRGDRSGNADMSSVSAVVVHRFYANTAPKSARPKIYIKKVTALDTSDKKLPAWYSMSPEEFFPFIDKYGQFKFKEWKNKVHSDADLQKFKAEEAKDLANNPGPKNWDEYGGWKGVKLEATGRFRVQKYGGKWWLVDPLGHLYWSHGVVRVTPSSAVTPLDNRKNYFESLPEKGDELALFYTTNDELLASYYTTRGIKETFDFSAANIFRKYGKNWREAYADISHRRLRSWGLNTIANSSDSFIFSQNKTPYIERIETRGPILEGSTGAWWGIVDPFSEEFVSHLKSVLESRRAEFSNPWCIGLFVDNELKWGKDGFLGKCALASSPDSAAKREFIKDLKAKYGDIASLNKAWNSKYKDWNDVLSNREVPAGANKGDLESFSLKIVDKYFSTISAVIKQFDPKLLYMGCRFYDRNHKIISIAAKYCDVVSFNAYNYRLDSVGMPLGIDKPIVIGEFHFGATSDTGLFNPTLCYTENQDCRAEAYKRYLTDALQNYHVIGTHWHQLSDQATTGRFDGENFQVGFTDVCDTPYSETIEALRQIGDSMYETRMSSPNNKPVKIK